MRKILERFCAEMTWFPATKGELVHLELPTLSTAAGLFTLSTSEAEEEGDSPKRQREEGYNVKNIS